jgi:hypothetical protein
VAIVTPKFEIHLIKTKIVEINAEDKDHAYEIAERRFPLDKNWDIDSVKETV